MEELKAKIEMGAERIRILLYSHRNKFLHELREAVERGWSDWAKQAAELHTFRADRENRLKASKGFYKLHEESIASICEDLEAEYQALADHHSEEVVQLLVDFGQDKLEVACHLHQYEVE